MLLIATLTAAALLACAWGLGERRQRRRLERELGTMRGAGHDAQDLALRSRAAFAEDLELEVLRVERSGRPASLVLFGLAIDDPGAGGAPAGDSRRLEFVRVLRSTVRTIDVGYRTGTNEFALILPDTRARGALVAVNRVQRLVADMRIEARAGIAETGPGIDRHTLFRHAYCALVAAGRDGRSAAVAYSPELERRTGADELPALAAIEPVEGSHRDPR